ncbi:MAG TPA: OmcB family cysteine-rich outer membrane protein, partial [bacterium]|nr:OmcB family cysteine-rich outer membrane protein [bacterium]
MLKNLRRFFNVKWQNIVALLIGMIAMLSMVSFATPVIATSDTLSEVSVQMANSEVFVVQQYWGPHQNNPSGYPSSVLAGTVSLASGQGGRYRIMATTLYNSDNAQYQLDESYYLSVNGQNGSAVLDNGVNPGTEVRDAGVFNFNEGLNKIYLNHYSLVYGDESYWTSKRSPSGQMMGQSVYIIALTLIPVDTVPEYQLTINKTAPSEIRLGEKMTYNINWSITGNSVANNVVVTDTLPEEVSLVSASGDYTQNGNQIIWDLGDIQTNAAGSMTITVAVNKKPLIGDLIKNKVVIASTDKNSEAIAETRIIYSDLLIDKIAPAEARSGEEIVYTLKWKVTGNTTLNNVILSDALPAEVSFVSASDTYVYNSTNKTITWSLGDIKPEASGYKTIKVKTASGLPVGTQIYNTADIVSGTKHKNDTEVTKIVAVPSYDVNITKFVDKTTAKVGDSLTYTLNWSVTGNMVAPNVVITDTLPQEVSLVSASDNYTIDGQVLTWELGDLQANVSGSKTITVKINSLPTTGNKVINTTEIHSGDKNKTATVETLVEEFNLFIDKIAPAQVHAGDEMTYTLNWRVTGNKTALNTIITDTLPSQVTFVSATGNYLQVGQKLTWNLGNITPEAYGSIDVVVKVNNDVPAGTNIYNTAVITSACKSVKDTEVTKVIAVPFYDVDIVKTVDKTTANVGDNLTYTLNWSVTGNMVAPNVVITDTLPQEVSLVSATDGYIENVQTLTWNLGDLTPNATGSMTITVKINSLPETGDKIINNTVITSGSKYAEASAETVVAVRPTFDLSIDKTAPAAAYPGDEMTYKIDWSVSGNALASNVVITENMPAGVSLLEVKGVNGSYSSIGNTYIFALGDKMPEATGTLELIVKVSNSAVGGDVLTNNVKIESGDKSAEASASTTVLGRHDYVVAIEKSAPVEVQAGDNINYSISWSVTGNMLAPDVVVTDTLPENVSFVSASGDYNYSTSTRELIWNLGSLQANATGTMQIVVATAAGASDGEQVVNNVMIVSGLKNALDDATTIIKNGGGGSDHNVGITKSAPTSITAGDNITYNISWNCTGNEDCVDVVITDNLPDKVTFVSASDNGAYDNTTREINWNLGNKQPGNSGSLTVVVDTNADNLSNGEVLTNNVKIQSGVKTANATANTTVNKGDNLVPGVKIEYDYPLKKTNGYSYVEQVRVINNGQVTLTNGALWIDLNEKILEMESMDKTTVFGDVKKQMFKWSIPTLEAGETFTLNFVVHAFDQDVYHMTDTYVAYFSDQAEAKAKGSEWVICPDVWYGRGDYEMSRGVGSTAPSATYKGQAPKRTTPLSTPAVKPVTVFTPTGTTAVSEAVEPDFLALTYTYAQTKEIKSSYLESVTVRNVGNTDLTNGSLMVDVPAEFITFVSATPSWDKHDATNETANWTIGSLKAGKDKTIKFTVSAKGVGTPKTKATAEFDQARKTVDWTETVKEVVKKASIVIAPATTSTAAVIVPKIEGAECQVCEICQTEKVGICAHCPWWLWLVIILIHILVLFVYYFFEAKEDMRQNEAGEYYIIKGGKGWMLPTFLALLVVFLLLYLVCAVTPWWALALILACYYLALVSNHFLIHKVDLKYGPFFPLLITLAVLIAYLICHSWYWWVLSAVIVFYIL